MMQVGEGLNSSNSYLSSLAEICDGYPLHTIKVNSSSATVYFHSDSSVTAGGFSLSYRSIKPSHIENSHGELNVSLT